MILEVNYKNNTSISIHLTNLHKDNKIRYAVRVYAPGISKELITRSYNRAKKYYASECQKIGG